MNTKTTSHSIDCIMPAAGLSTRMGEWKPLLPYANSTIIEVSVNNALAFCSQVILVVGHRSDELTDKMRHYPKVKIVTNDNYQQGMFSSILKGVEYVNSNYFFITHADMPCIHPDIFQKLWQNKSAGATFPGTHSLSGHPVLINANLKAAILAESQTTSMKSILNRFNCHYLQLDDPSIHLDVDTPEAYQRLLAHNK